MMMRIDDADDEIIMMEVERRGEGRERERERERGGGTDEEEEGEEVSSSSKKSRERIRKIRRRLSRLCERYHIPYGMLYEQILVRLSDLLEKKRIEFTIEKQYRIVVRLPDQEQEEEKEQDFRLPELATLTLYRYNGSSSNNNSNSGRFICQCLIPLRP